MRCVKFPTDIRVGTEGFTTAENLLYRLTPVGRRLLADASENVLRTSMELGGNAPFIVFEDADLDAAVQGAMAAKMRNMGEACTAANRFLVHESVATEFTAKFAAAMGDLVTTRGTNPETIVGPLIDGGKREDVHALVTRAVAEGATIAVGGAPVEGADYFYAPTVLANAPPTAAILNSEIFGPIAPVSTFRTEAEAIKLADSTQYGLASYLFSRDYNRLLRTTDQIDFGMVGSAPASSPMLPPRWWRKAIRAWPRGRRGGHCRVHHNPVHRP